MEASSELGEPLIPPGGANATTAAAANLGGHLAALEAVYCLTDLNPQTLGRVYHQNLMV